MDAKTLYKIGRKMKDGLSPAQSFMPMNEYMLNKALHKFADATMAVAKEMEEATMKKVRIEEYFVPIDGFPNYEVSSYGRIVNIKNDRDLNPQPRKSGYLVVKLYKEGVSTSFQVHRIVAKAFFVNYREGYEVKHINNNLTENTVANIHISPKRNRLRES